MLSQELRQQAADALYDADTQRHLIPQLSKSYEGIELEDGMGRVLTFKHLSPQWIEVSIHEGRYHIIRRLMEAVDVRVLRLIRTNFGPISLGDTPPGRWRDLNDGELFNLRKALDIKP